MHHAIQRRMLHGLVQVGFEAVARCIEQGIQYALSGLGYTRSSFHFSNLEQPGPVLCRPVELTQLLRDLMQRTCWTRLMR
jgi:hypothetical protein